MILPFYGFVKGANTNISPLIHPQDQPAVLNGCTTSWKLGAITKDTGYVVVGSALQANKSITGMFNFIQQPGTEKMLATIDDATSDDTQLFYSTGGAWTEIATAETAWANFAGINVEMESFIGYCFFVGYGETDGFLPVLSLTGTTTSTSVNVTSMPQAKFIRRYRDRLYIANCKDSGTTYPYRVYFSSVPTAGAITWDTTNNFFDVDFSDQITGIAEAWDRFLIFTQYRTYSYDQTSKKKVWDYGCSNHRTIKQSGSYLVWANYDGVWVSTGGQPQNISGEVQDFIRAGDPTTYFAEIIDEEYHLYVGNVTVNGLTYSNCVLTFNIPLSSWRWREYGHTPTIMARYNSSGTQRLWLGDTTGKVYNKGKYTDAVLLSDDNGLEISSTFELPPINLQTLDKLKRINEIITFAERSGNLKLFCRVIDTNQRKLTKFMPITGLTEFINHTHPNLQDGVILQICASDNSKLPYWSFYGFALDIEPKSRIN